MCYVLTISLESQREKEIVSVMKLANKKLFRITTEIIALNRTQAIYMYIFIIYI